MDTGGPARSTTVAPPEGGDQFWRRTGGTKLAGGGDDVTGPCHCATRGPALDGATRVDPPLPCHGLASTRLAAHAGAAAVDFQLALPPRLTHGGTVPPCHVREISRSAGRWFVREGEF